MEAVKQGSCAVGLTVSGGGALGSMTRARTTMPPPSRRTPRSAERHARGAGHAQALRVRALELPAQGFQDRRPHGHRHLRPHGGRQDPVPLHAQRVPQPPVSAPVLGVGLRRSPRHVWQRCLAPMLLLAQVRVRDAHAGGAAGAAGGGQAPDMHAAVVEAALRRGPAGGGVRQHGAAPLQHVPQRQLLGVQGHGHRRPRPGARAGRREGGRAAPSFMVVRGAAAACRALRRWDSWDQREAC